MERWRGTDRQKSGKADSTPRHTDRAVFDFAEISCTRPKANSEASEVARCHRRLATWQGHHLNSVEP